LAKMFGWVIKKDKYNFGNKNLFSFSEF
jgi:hypothetical protein